MKNYQLLTKNLGIALGAAFLLTQVGCRLPGPPGLPGLPHPPGLPHGELRNPVRTAAVIPADEATNQNDAVQIVPNGMSVPERENSKTAGFQK